MSEQPIEATVTELAPHQTGSLVQPAGSLVEIEQAFQSYQQLCSRILDDSDYQTIKDRKFRKRSAWRKLALAYGVSFEIRERNASHDSEERIEQAEFVVRATAPNGRFADGWGACSVTERCCIQPCPKRSWSKHYCCPTDDHDPRSHFSHAEHDIPATAETRAKNRAAADLFGLGEVSAEEIVGNGERTEPAPEQKAKPAAKKKAEPKEELPPSERPAGKVILAKIAHAEKHREVDDAFRLFLLDAWATDDKPVESVDQLSAESADAYLDLLLSDERLNEQKVKYGSGAFKTEGAADPEPPF